MDVRHGIVWIRQEFRVEVPFYRYTGSWQPEPAGAPPIEGPGWNDVDEAIWWARQRAPRVFVTPFGTGERFNAGERDGNAPSGPWPDTTTGGVGSRRPEYGGACYINEEPVWFRELVEFNAWWWDDDKNLRGLETFSAIDVAIDWGRERAPVVLVFEAQRSDPDPLYRVRSAGDEPQDAQ